MPNKAPTAHNAASRGDIAPTVIMPGDPLRAKYIAETFLSDVKCYSEIRGMYGYTGTYNGKPVSVQGHGMGIPSVGIYTYELYNFYGVERIIRVGSNGSLQPHLKLGDVVATMGACTDSNYAWQYRLDGTFAPIASYGLLEAAVNAARARSLPIHVGNVLCSDVFYNDDTDSLRRWADMGVLVVEMESMGLYCNAAKAGKQALCLTTVSDRMFTGEVLSPSERQTGMNNMVQLALDIL